MYSKIGFSLIWRSIFPIVVVSSTGRSFFSILIIFTSLNHKRCLSASEKIDSEYHFLPRIFYRELSSANFMLQSAADGYVMLSSPVAVPNQNFGSALLQIAIKSHLFPCYLAEKLLR
ncbi:hypothetical protein XBI1_3080056 [Xenorhabdus bovienii str. Intermedium]|uniref:Uncharacterized protein n=1 Tax=Xenorhabdus bovienii str. Intermedium TaxID=1379677 RepID=A0A077QEJ2_XENBV|nr:hypothetical protein XBI1_3080056 [Xenorhabdus bovienii str. Intermedium]